MMRTAPAQFQTWLASLSDHEKNVPFYNYIRYLKEKGDLDTILRLSDNPPTGVSVWFFHDAEVAKLFAQKDPQAAIAWASLRNSESNKNSALFAIGESWDKTNTNAFFAQMNALENREAAEKITVGYVTSWGNESPEAAAAWLLNNARNNDAMTSTCVGEFFQNWIDSDAMAATQWLAKLPEGNTRMEAIAFLVRSDEAAKSPQDVLSWVMTLPADSNGSESRIAMLGTLMENAIRLGNAATDALLAQPALTQNERAHLQKKVEEAYLKK